MHKCATFSRICKAYWQSVKRKRTQKRGFGGLFLKNNLKVEVKHKFRGEIFVFHKQYTMKQVLLKWFLQTEIHEIIVL